LERRRHPAHGGWLRVKPAPHRQLSLAGRRAASRGSQELEHSSLLWGSVRDDVGSCLLQIPATNILPLATEKRKTGTWSDAWLLLLKLGGGWSLFHQPACR